MKVEFRKNTNFQVFSISACQKLEFIKYFLQTLKAGAFANVLK